MIYQVEIDTDLEFGVVILEIEAENEIVAKKLALKECVRRYSKEYKESRDTALRYTQKYRNLLRRKENGIRYV